MNEELSKVKEALEAAHAQIEYLHEKFGSNETGRIVEAMIVTALSEFSALSALSHLEQEPRGRGHCITCMASCAHSVGNGAHVVADHPEDSLDMVRLEREMDAVELRDIALYFDQLGKKSNGDFLRKLAEKYLAHPCASGKDAERPVVREIANERERQMSAEGWTEAHDDEHADRSMAQAARCYVEHYVGRSWLLDDNPDGLQQYRFEKMPFEWPNSWDESWWKPKNPRRDLVRAAALIVAEIERIDRAALAQKGGGNV